MAASVGTGLKIRQAPNVAGDVSRCSIVGYGSIQLFRPAAAGDVVLSFAISCNDLPTFVEFLSRKVPAPFGNVNRTKAG